MEAICDRFQASAPSGILHCEAGGHECATQFLCAAKGCNIAACEVHSWLCTHCGDAYCHACAGKLDSDGRCEGCLLSNTCEECGEWSEDLRTMGDSDGATGYHATSEMCPACVRRIRNRRAA